MVLDSVLCFLEEGIVLASDASLVMTVVMFVAVAVAVVMTPNGAVRQKVKNEENTARSQPLDKLLRRVLRVVEVVEAEADGGDVESRKTGTSKGGRGRVLWVSKVTMVGVHLVLCKALRLSAAVVMTRECAMLWRAVQPRRLWPTKRYCAGRGRRG